METPLFVYRAQNRKISGSFDFTERNLHLQDALSSDYKLVAELDTLDEHGLKRIKVLAARNYSRDFKIVTTRYAEFHYYPGSVDEEICDKIIFSIKNAP